MNLHLKCAILKRIVMVLGLLEWASLPIATFFLGAKETNVAMWFFLASAISYILGYEISYKVQHLIIRLELERNKDE